MLFPVIAAVAFLLVLHIIGVAAVDPNMDVKTPTLHSDTVARILYKTGNWDLMADLCLHSRQLQSWLLDPLAVRGVLSHGMASPGDLYVVLKKAVTRSPSNPFVAATANAIVFSHTQAKRLIDIVLKLDDYMAVAVFRILITVLKVGVVADLAFSVAAFYSNRPDLQRQLLQLAPWGGLRPRTSLTACVLDHVSPQHHWSMNRSIIARLSQSILTPHLLCDLQRNLVRLDLATVLDLGQPTAPNLVQIYPWIKKDHDDGDLYGYSALRMYLFRKQSRNLSMVRDLLRQSDFIPVRAGSGTRARALVDELIRTDDAEGLTVVSEHNLYRELVTSGTYWPLHAACAYGAFNVLKNVLVYSWPRLDWNESDGDGRSLRQVLQQAEIHRDRRHLMKRIVNDEIAKQRNRNRRVAVRRFFSSFTMRV